MRLIKALFIISGLFSFHYGTSQEKISVQLKSTEVIENDNEVNKSTPERRSFTLQAFLIDPSKEVEEKTHTAIFLDSIEPERNKSRKEVYLTAKPIGDTSSEIHQKIQVVDGHQKVRKENRIELKAILIPAEE